MNALGNGSTAELPSHSVSARLAAWIKDLLAPWLAVHPATYLLVEVLIVAAMVDLVLGSWFGPVDTMLAGSLAPASLAVLALISFAGGDRWPTRLLAWFVVGVILLFSRRDCVGIAWAAALPERLVATVAWGTVLAALAAPISTLPGFRRLFFGRSESMHWSHARLVAFALVVSLSLMLFGPLIYLGATPLELLFSDPKEWQKFLAPGVRGTGSSPVQNILIYSGSCSLCRWSSDMVSGATRAKCSNA